MGGWLLAPAWVPGLGSARAGGSAPTGWAYNAAMTSHFSTHGKDLRKGRVSMPGSVYHITTVTRDREPVFLDFKAARLFIGTLREAELRGEASTLAFVLMPDHLHWLMQLGSQRALSRVVGSVKNVIAHRLKRRIWQSGFHDHGVQAEEDLRLIARYIVANPLRAGLVEHLEDYPHWDARWL
jgi:putative transposase